MQHRTSIILFFFVVFSVPAFAHMSAGELSLDCDAITTKRSEVWDVDRTSKSGLCLGYLNAVFDFIDSDTQFEVTRDFNVAAMMECFQRYAPKHNGDPADKAVVSALIGDGYIKRREN